MAARRPFDEPWKRIIEALFADFVAMFLPEAHAEIDWSVPAKFLDKELARIARGARGGRRTADKLAEVQLRSGEEAWVLVHVEVQAQRDESFARRMFRYHLRIFDHFDREPVSVAILADPAAAWRPDSYGYGRWGTSMRLRFPVVKLADWSDHIEELASSDNPFGIAVAAHLAALATAKRDATRYAQRLRLYRAVRRKGLSEEKAGALLTFMDWVLDLPEDLDDRFWNEVRVEEESEPMRYMTRMEERAEERGLLEGRTLGVEEGRTLGVEEGRTLGVEEGRTLGVEEGKALGILVGKAAGMRESLLFLLEGKFGPIPADVRDRIERMDDTERLGALIGRVLDATDLAGMGI
jgi:hypothetical protein